MPSYTWFGKMMVIAAGLAVVVSTIHAQPRPSGRITGICSGCGDEEGPYQPWILSSIDHWGYGYDSLLAELPKWRGSQYIRVDSVGASVQNRAIWQLTITDPASTIFPKRAVFIHARTHPSEVQAFRVADAIIDYLTSDAEYAAYLRRAAVFYVIPMYNPDGVELELARQNAHEVDLERNWDEPVPEPEVATLRRRFMEIMASPESLSIALNLHSAGDCKRYFVYHDTIGVSSPYTRHERRFIDAVRSFFPNGIEAWNYDMRWQTGTLTNFPEGWWWTQHGENVLALTYEDMNCPDAGQYDTTAWAIIHGIGVYLGLQDVSAAPGIAAIPEQAELRGAFPNPFKTQTTIRYALAHSGPVHLAIMNLLGQEIETLVDESQASGDHETVWRPKSAASGAYLCVLHAGNLTQSRVLRLIR